MELQLLSAATRHSMVPAVAEGVLKVHNRLVVLAVALEADYLQV